MTSPLSIQKTLAGRHILFTGASGFLGKVWLSMMLDRVPDVGRIYVLIRGKSTATASQRFERMVNESYAFAPLHERHGAALSAFLSARVEVVDGDVSREGLGIAPEVATRIQAKLDAFVHCAGQVDFDPAVDDALDTNVDGSIHAGAFAQGAKGCRFVQISTCFVAGNRDGHIAETFTPNYAPVREGFDAAAEYDLLKKRIAEVREDTVGEAALAQLRLDLIKSVEEKGHDSGNKQLIDRILKRESTAALKERLVDLGKERAKYWGWQNVYTFTKSMAESLLFERYPDLPKTIFRPSITESAVSFPIPGWNEGLNTSGPLIYFMGTWFRHMPGKRDKPLDVIPVDYCVASLISATVALLEDRHDEVYQCSSSGENPITVGRCLDLTALAHRKYLRNNGDSALERVILSRWDGRGVPEDHFMGVSNMRTVVRAVSDATKDAPSGLGEKLGKRLKKIASKADRAGRRLNIVEKVFETYRPFTVNNSRQVYAARHLSELPVEEEQFRFEPKKLDWRRYWIDAHVPGLRRWSFPLIENKRIEQYSPETPFVLLPSTLTQKDGKDASSGSVEDQQAPEVAE